MAGELSDVEHGLLAQVAGELDDELDAVTIALERLAEAARRVRAAELLGADFDEPAPVAARA